MKELILIIGPPVGWILWALGGWDWRINGKEIFAHGKIFRRIFFPIWAGLVGWWFYSIIPTAVVTAVILCIYVWCVGYGDESVLSKYFGRIAAKVIYGIGLSLTTFLYGLTFYNILVAISFPLLTMISMKGKLTWKLVEGITGLLVILTIVH